MKGCFTFQWGGGGGGRRPPPPPPPTMGNPAAPLLRGPAPAPYFHPLFLIFQNSPFSGNQNLLPPFKKEGGGGVPNYAC